MRYFINQIKFVKWNDILACILFLAALPMSWVYKIKRKNLWLVCERSHEACDNGYWFYKYVCEKHPEQDIVYAIKKETADYDKVKKLRGEIIEFGSLKHWIYYLSANINISSQKGGKPNAAVCHFLEIYGIIKNRRVYLKHGIVCNDLKWHYYNVTKMWMYVNSTKKEMDFCEKKFGYPKENLVLTGLCRYDNLNNELTQNDVLLIMPTHREWLYRPTKEFEKYDAVFSFEDTEYFKAWKAILEDKRLSELAKEKKIKIVFFLHANMKQYMHHFSDLNSIAEIKSSSNDDVQSMMKKASMMITDYSSVNFDFAYMQKPLLYYQFDYEKFRDGHYQEGYFSYKSDGFGSVCEDADELIDHACNLIESNMKMPDVYKKRVEDFFEFHDNQNCERVYDAILQKIVAEQA